MTPDRDYLSVYVSGLPTEVEFGATVNGAVTINGKVCRNTTIGVIRLSATNGLRATASLDKSNVSVEGPVDRFGESVLSFSDIDGLTVEIIRIEPTPAAEVWTGGSVPADATLRGFHTATISQISHEPTERTLRETMGFRLVDREDNRFRYAVDSGGAAKTVDILCAPGAAFGQVAVGTVHHIAWRTPDDANEPGMKSTELGFTHRFEPGTRPETLLMLHGTGGDENDMVALGRELLPGAAIISPRGKVLENGMPRFFRGLAMGVFDVENLRHNTAELAEFIRRVAIAYELQAHSILTVGYSNGANIAASLLLLHPEVLAGAVLFRPMVPLVPDVVPILNGIPVLIAAAHQDPYAGEKETERLSELLKGGGADVKTQWVPGGHGLTQLDIDAAKGWLGAHFAASEQNTEAR
ncbi:MAG TPA: dienelactone hydrolase family protein [Bryobacteraceae bacterium]|nr:dienelactone hydrolase family protein [Bryobacteraceae bacterium]